MPERATEIAAIVCPRIDTNSLGRAIACAQVAHSAGFATQIYGWRKEAERWRVLDALWPGPIIDLGPFPSPGNFGLRVRQAAETVGGVDVVWSIKANPASVSVAAVLQVGGATWIADQDDDELAFVTGSRVRNAGRHVVRVESAMRLKRAKRSLEGAADLLTGPYQMSAVGPYACIPHVRPDPFSFSIRDGAAPSRIDHLRAKGVRVATFCGTLRPHKGAALLQHLRETFSREGDVAIMTVGDVNIPATEHDFGRLPWPASMAVLANSDLVLMPLDPSSPIAARQFPAKMVDALAVGAPLLATPVGPSAPVVTKVGLPISDLTPKAWVSAITEVDMPAMDAMSVRARELWSAEYTPEIAAGRLVRHLERRTR